MSTSLMMTKLHPSVARAHLVPRPRLIERLDAGLHHDRALLLISAPAGFGKTTLLVDWLRRQALPTAWLSLDAGDNDPVRFLAYVTAAVQTAYPDINRDSAVAQHMAPSPRIEPLLTTLINEIGAAAQPAILIFDDYHVIEAPVVHEAVAFLIEHLPPQVHVIIAGRTTARDRLWAQHLCGVRGFDVSPCFYRAATLWRSPACTRAGAARRADGTGDRSGAGSVGVAGTGLSGIAKVDLAVSTLERALRLGEPRGYVRIFIDEGGPMGDLLRHLAARGQHIDYVNRLLTALQVDGIRKAERLPRATLTHQSLIEPLTNRELEVLRLVSISQSNEAIAQTLVISIETVKKHLKNIYGKLAVHHRVDAVQRARELNLL
jgi:ATP/maltotriose-dependent transcriptional regulator MalT